MLELESGYKEPEEEKALSTEKALSDENALVVYDGKKKSAKPSSSESRLLLKLIICIAALIVSVAAKYYYPEATDRLSRYIFKSVDYSEAFNAVGKALTGEEKLSDTFKTLYIMIFEDTEQPQASTAPESETPQENASQQPEEEAPETKEQTKQAENKAGTFPTQKTVHLPGQWHASVIVTAKNAVTSDSEPADEPS